MRYKGDIMPLKKNYIPEPMIVQNIRANHGTTRVHHYHYGRCVNSSTCRNIAGRFGVEVESVGSVDSEILPYLFNRADIPFTAENDSSVTVEYVTKPLNTKKENYKKISKAIQMAVDISKENPQLPSFRINDNCGTHIHMTFNSNPKLETIGLFLKRLQNAIIETPELGDLFGRNLGNFHYAAEMPRVFFKSGYGDYHVRTIDRYYWLNFPVDLPTIEFRLAKFINEGQFYNLLILCEYLTKKIGQIVDGVYTQKKAWNLTWKYIKGLLKKNQTPIPRIRFKEQLNLL